MQIGRPLRAVVLGSGFAGALAARACAGSGYDVSVIDKDAALDGPRAGAPHAQQLHNLLGRAQRHLRDLVPQVVVRFDAAGGVRVPVSTATRVFELGRLMPARDLGLEIWSAPKHVIDAVAREGLDEIVTLRLGCRADGLVVADGRVTGVLTDGETLPADLVVDALGARSPVERWLGDSAPATQQYIVRQWYSTMVMSLPGAAARIFWLTFPTAPRSRGGLASPLNDGTWNVSLSGGPDDASPSDVDEFVAYAASLEDPELGRLVRSGTALSVPRTFRKPTASWRRYDEAPGLPSRLVSIGDSVADLNPLVGQGLSVAAWQAGALAAVLDNGADLDSACSMFAPQAAEAVQAAWDLMTVFDERAARVLFSPDAWDRVAAAIDSDPVAHRRYVEVWHLLQSVESLQELARQDPASVVR